jgi:multidrug efflux pump
VLGFPFLTLLVFFATIALTVVLYIKTPKGYFPTDDSGFVIGATRASPDTSFQAMLGLQQQLADIVMADPAGRQASAPRSAAPLARAAAAPTAAPCSSA